MDKVMYLFLATVILLGLYNTVAANVVGHYNYREGVSIRFCGLSRYSLHPELVADAPARQPLTTTGLAAARSVRAPPAVRSLCE